MSSQTVAQKRLAGATLGLYLLFLAWVFLWPSAGPASTSVDKTLQWLWDAGFSTDLVTGPRVEFVLNALMLAPVPILATLAGARWSWERWTAYAFVAASTVELFQGVALPNRSAQFQDIASNTAGALVGAVLSHLVLTVTSRVRQDGGAQGSRRR